MKEGVKAMLFELLTETEKEMMMKYIDAYAGGHSSDQASLDFIMRFWETNKRDLFKLLGNKFIYEVPYVGEEPIEKLIRTFDEYFSYWAPDKALYDLHEKVYGKIDCSREIQDTPLCGDNRSWYDEEYIKSHVWRDDLMELFYALFKSSALAYNEYEGPTKKFTFNNGKVYQFPAGAKTVKLIGRLCEMLEIDNEYFVE